MSILTPSASTFKPAVVADPCPASLPEPESGPEHTHLALWFDGSCEPVNPGGVGTYGWLVPAGGEILDTGRGVACSGATATNNIAEYTALARALQHFADAGWTGRLHIHGDSPLVVRQVSGAWACKAPDLRELRDRCRELFTRVCPADGYSLTWIPRDQNGAADALARAAYPEYLLGQPTVGVLLESDGWAHR